METLRGNAQVTLCDATAVIDTKDYYNERWEMIIG